MLLGNTKDNVQDTWSTSSIRKKDGPTPVIVFLGIVIDTVKQEMRLPEDKPQRLLSTLQEWEDKKRLFS